MPKFKQYKGSPDIFTQEGKRITEQEAQTAGLFLPEGKLSSDVEQLQIIRPDIAQESQFVPKAGTDITDTTNINQTISSLYGKKTPYEIEMERQGEEARLGSQTTIDSEKIYQDKLKQMQAEIDATNLVFANKLLEAQKAGAGRLGQQTAIAARRGLAGSDFGEAAREDVVSLNQEIYGGIEAEKAAAISAIHRQVRNESEAELKAQTEAKKGSAEKYLTFLSQQEVKTGEKHKKAALFALNSNVDPTTLTDAQFNDTYPDYDRNTLIAEYNELKAGRDKATQEADIKKSEAKIKEREIALKETKNKAEIDKINAEIAESNYDEIDAGDRVIIWDKKTGKQVASYAKGVTPKAADEKTADVVTSSAQDWLSQFNSGLMSIEDIYTKIGSSKESIPLKNEIARLINQQGGKRVYGADDATIQAITSQIKNIDDLLEGGKFGKIVGLVQGGAGVFPDIWNVGKQDALAIAKNLVSNQTLTALAEAKSKGITFGALSEKELSVVAESASRIAAKLQTDKGFFGKGTGEITGFSGSQREFEKDLKAIKEGLEKSIAGKTQTGDTDDDLLKQYGL